MKELLKDIISEVLEEMFFMVPEGLEGVGLQARGDLLAEIVLRGERSIRLMFLLSKATAEQMAQNLLPGEETTPQLVKDVLKEFANMVGGNLIKYLGVDWRLGLPEVYEGIEALGLLGSRQPIMEFDVDGEILSVYLEG